MKKYNSYFVFLVTGLLTACGADSEGYRSTPVKVMASSGNTVELTGTWKSACHSNGSNDIIDVRIYFSNGSVTGSTEKYSSNDNSCTSLVSNDAYATSSKVTVSTNKAATGWRNGSGGAASAPNSQAGPALSSTPTVTTYSLVQDNSTTIKSIDLVDDSTGSWVLYRADTVAGVDGSGYYNYLATVYPLTKQ